MTRLLVVLLCSLLLGSAPPPPGGAGAAAPTAPTGAVAAAGAERTSQPEDLSVYLEYAAAGLPADGLAELRRAVALAARRDAGAVAAFARAAEAVPGLSDWARVLGADAAAEMGDTAAVRRLLAGAEPVLAQEVGWRARMRALRLAGDSAGALRVALLASDSLRSDSRRADAARTAGDLLLAARDTGAALTQYRRAIAIAPGAAAAVTAARILPGLPSATPEDHLLAGRTYLRHGNLERAAAGIDRFLAADGGSPEERTRARLELGRALFDARRYAAAEKRLAAVAAGSAHPELNAEALFILARTRYRLRRTEEARATFASVHERFPGQPAAAAALFMLADLEHDDDRLERAQSLYRRVMEGAPGSERAAEAAMRLGGMAFAARDFAGAAQIFEDARRAFPSEERRQQATFWAGRAYLALEDTLLGFARLREAGPLDPASFYGIRAADLLGDADWRARLARPPVVTEVDRLHATGARRRLDALAALGLDAAATHEMDRIRRHFTGRPAGLYLLAEAHHERGDTYAGVRLGREIQRMEGEWNERLLRIVYPFPYRESIVREARRSGVDPYLAAGLVRQESLFNPVAVSGAGAVGLMQVLPSTGRTVGRKLGVRTVATSTLKRPELNVRLGMRYLADLLERYEGRVGYMLAAYNAGPTRVARWRGLPEAEDADLFAERIPFEETRHYVKVVQQNARIYRALYGGDEQPATQ